jgi:UDP-4-amino-4,6-dideoxy-N-acetyl-beta-L-altrosamine transaminase
VSEERPLPYGRHAIDQDDCDAVLEVLRGDWLTTGPVVGAFERALAERCGAAEAVSCSNGTAALHLACLALGLGGEDTAIVPAVTFLATANAPRMTGAEVVFADVDPESGLMEAHHLADAIARATTAGRRPRVVLPVHLGGQCADLAAISTLARQHGMAVIEDACHALGTVYRRPNGAPAAIGACAHSDLTVFSFHPVKTITTGEGGAITTRDPALAGRMRRLRSHGIVREAAAFADHAAGFDGRRANPWYYEMAEIGFNYRISDINCALGLSQLSKLDRIAAARRVLVEQYDRRLAPLAPLVQRVRRNPAALPVWHLLGVLIDFARAGRPRGDVMRALQERGIGSQVHYIPVHRQPYYRRRYGSLPLPGAEAYYARALSLPLYIGMTGADVDRVVDRLAECLAARSGAGRSRAPAAE